MKEEDWQTGFIEHGPCRLEYKTLEKLNRPWMVFIHGYGQDFRSFSPVYDVLGDQYSFLSLHIFYHGESTIEGSSPLKPSDWKKVVELLFDKLEIDQAYWMGFSMGAKFLLKAYEMLPSLFSGISLFAPDGLVMNPWYKFATETIPGRLLLQFLIRAFPVFRIFVKALVKLGLLRASMGRFTMSELAYSEGRNRVLRTWLGFRNLWPKIQILSSNAKKTSIPILLVLGKYDGIIPLKRFSQIGKKLPTADWLILDTGHAGLLAKFAVYLAKKS
jgi:pimeloyl-ACP methyl ester carboxylesterase